MATVCSAFRAAAKLVLETATHTKVLELDEREEQPDRLDSKMLLDWAPQCIRRLGLTGVVCGVRGMAALVSASTQLRKLTLDCSWDMVQCAQAEAILAACHSLKILTCSGTFMPSQIPSSVTALKVDLSWWSKLAMRGYAPEGQLQALLFRLRSASALQRLWLCLGQLPMLPAVPEIQLHHLHEVILHFSIGSGKPANLDWLQEQSIDELSLSIKITTGALSDHSDLVQQLQGLTLHRLELTVHAVVELAAQLLWAGLVVKGELSISIFRGVALVALLQSRWRTITLHAQPTLQPCETFDIHWAALASCHGKVQVFTKRHYQIIGCPGAAPDFRQPWQLRASLGRSQHCFVNSLVLPCRIADHLLVQNYAADVAGWHRNTVWPTVSSEGWE